MVQTIEGPKEVTELLTDLSNKYEAVSGQHMLCVILPQCPWLLACICTAAEGNSVA